MEPILALAPAGAERHCVGRAPGRRALPQREVNALLVDARPAIRTSCVSRAAIRSWRRAGARRRSRCATAGIEVRVLPGVSAALAAPAAAGIPLMLRQGSVTATFVDGNDDDEHARAARTGRRSPASAARSSILTGRGRIRRIAAALIERRPRPRHAARGDQRRRPPGAAGAARARSPSCPRRCRRP